MNYLHTDIPAGMRIAEYRRMRPITAQTHPSATRKRALLRRLQGRTR